MRDNHPKRIYRPRLKHAMSAIGVRITDEDIAKLDRLAYKLGGSRSDAVRHLLTLIDA